MSGWTVLAWLSKKKKKKKKVTTTVKKKKTGYQQCEGKTKAS